MKRSREWKRSFTNLISAKLGLLQTCIPDWDCLDLLRWMVVCIFRFWKPETVCSPYGGDGSIWEHTYCVRTLFLLPFTTWTAGQMSPIKELPLYFNIILSYSTQKASVGCNLVTHFSWRLSFSTFAGIWLLWLSIIVHFSCAHHWWEPRCSAWRCGQVFKHCLGSYTVLCMLEGKAGWE